jgi:hypothetical protein
MEQCLRLSNPTSLFDRLCDTRIIPFNLRVYEEQCENLSKEILKTLEKVKPGALICCSWCDASVGKSSMNGGAIDVPVKSWGIFVGLIGAKIKHIILAQNSFKYTDGLFDLDYTAIPIGWAVEIEVIVPEYLPRNVVADLTRSFIAVNKQTNTMQRTRTPRTFQHRMQRLSTHDRPY